MKDNGGTIEKLFDGDNNGDCNGDINGDNNRESKTFTMTALRGQQWRQKWRQLRKQKQRGQRNSKADYNLGQLYINDTQSEKWRYKHNICTINTASQPPRKIE